MKFAISASVGLLVGLLAGFFLGRLWLEHEWSEPFHSITPAEEKKAAIDGADPTPKAGTAVLRRLPIGKARSVLHEWTKGDPARVTLGAVGSGDGEELHVVVENRGACKITQLSGVAYGFDAKGRSASMNKGSEHYVAFASEEAIAPGEKAVVAQTMHHAKLATLAVAHVDAFRCEDGTSWRRP